VDAEARQKHWQRTYETKSARDVSWHQDDPEPSLTMVARVAASTASRIVDIGGGSSPLVDHLVQHAYRNVSVLDLSSAALANAQSRLGPLASQVNWLVGDVTTWKPQRSFDVWHDRAAFHFMVSEADRCAYLERLRRALVPGGHAIMATFALDGPEKCSGLPVMRYDAASLADTLGQEFTLVRSEPHGHRTPWGAVQSFQFSVFARRAAIS